MTTTDAQLERGVLVGVVPLIIPLAKYPEEETMTYETRVWVF